MKLLVAAHGTRGDLQPGFALAHALAAAGHEVTILTPQAFASWAAERMRVVTVPVDLRASLTAPRVLSTMHSGSPWRFAQVANALELESDRAFYDVLVEASAGVDAILTHPLLLERAAAVAEYRGLPILPFCPLPFWKTQAFSSPVLGGRPLGPLNGASHWLFEKLAGKSQRTLMVAWRQRLGLSAMKQLSYTRIQRDRVPSLEVYSSTLCPKPADWGEERIMTGLLRPSAPLRAAMGETALSPELERWLAQGSPPVFITFGSQPLLGRPGLVQGLLATLAKRKLRAIFDMGWSPMPGVVDSAEVLWVRGVNHAALLPRCAIALHHGGAGSTAAAAEAGIPAIVCAAVIDQPFWARRIEALGVGKHLPYRQLSEKTFSAALETVLDVGVRERARELGAVMANENGATNIGRAVLSALRV